MMTNTVAEKKCCICETSLKKHNNITQLLQCPSCGFVCADTSVSDEDIKKLYTSRYFNGEEYTDYLADKELHEWNFKQRVKRLEKIAGCLKDKSIFEIGCAYGLFLKVARESSNDVSGIDISNDAVDYAKKHLAIDATCGEYLDVPIEKNSKDIICMWDTIEHLSEPAAYVKKISEELKPNGILAITTGDIDSMNAKIRGNKWRQIHPPTHLQYFSKKTLTDLLTRHGFEICDVSYPGNRLSVNNIVYTILCLRLNKSKLYESLKGIHLLKTGTLYINLHDYMYIIAKKRNG